jgi:alanine dehydrogenase
MERALRYLSRSDVVSLGLGPDEVLDLVDKAFQEKATDDVEMPPKIGVHPRDDAFIHAMPAHLRRSDQVGVKWVAGYPTNSRIDGMPYLHGLLILTEAETGRPTAVMDATWITEVRTAAASFLGIRRLIAGAPEVVGLIGCGRQAQSHLALLSELYAVPRVLLYDPVTERAQECARAVGGERGVVVDRPQAAAAADLVISSAPIVKDPVRTIGVADVRPETVLCAVDFDSTFGPDIAEAATQVVVDDAAQYLYYRGQGYFDGYPDDPVEVSGLPPSPTSTGIQLYAPLGIALADIAVGGEIVRRAADQGAGQLLEL